MEGSVIGAVVGLYGRGAVFLPLPPGRGKARVTPADLLSRSSSLLLAAGCFDIHHISLRLDAGSTLLAGRRTVPASLTT